MKGRSEAENKLFFCSCKMCKNLSSFFPQQFTRLVAERNIDRKKSQKVKPKPSEGRKDLTGVRVIQRNLVYVMGLPLDLADEDVTLPAKLISLALTFALKRNHLFHLINLGFFMYAALSA